MPKPIKTEKVCVCERGKMSMYDSMREIVCVFMSIFEPFERL